MDLLDQIAASPERMREFQRRASGNGSHRVDLAHHG